MSGQLFNLFFWGFMPLVFSLVAVMFVRGYLLSVSVVDKPNARSSHSVPTPRGGGLGFMPIIFIFGIVYAFYHQDDYRLLVQLSLAFVLCSISWLDDLYDIAPKIRFIAQTAVVALALHLTIDLPLHWNPFLHAIVFLVFLFGWVWFINLYNFMDGIDGITSIQTVVLLIGLAMIFPDYNPLYLVIGGSVLGFLFWNSPPAKIFMGDIGSIGLGFLMGYFLIQLALTGYEGFLQALILPLYYIGDTTITLGKRIYRREKFWQAHRQHFYQKITTDNKTTHVFANIYILFCNVCLILCSMWVPTLGFFSLILALGVVAALLAFFNSVKKK